MGLNFQICIEVKKIRNMSIEIPSIVGAHPQFIKYAVFSRAIKHQNNLSGICLIKKCLSFISVTIRIRIYPGFSE